MPNFLNLNIQGADGMVLKGLGKNLEAIVAVYTQINRKEVYLGCMEIIDFDTLLKSAEFDRIGTQWVPGRG